MNMPASYHTQRGATLVIGLIMLVLITLMVTTAFNLSGTNLKSVANMQSRDEAIAAANNALEVVLGSPFTNAPVDQEINVDINNNNTTDYEVFISAPVCIRAAVDVAAAVSSLTLGAAMSTVNKWNTTWDIQANVNDARTSARTIVNVGARVLLTQTQKDAVCP